MKIIKITACSECRHFMHDSDREYEYCMEDALFRILKSPYNIPSWCSLKINLIEQLFEHRLGILLARSFKHKRSYPVISINIMSGEIECKRLKNKLHYMGPKKNCTLWYKERDRKTDEYKGRC